MTGSSARAGARVRVWPPTRPPRPGEAVRARCARCGLDWDVHEALAGFRLRCECDAWVAVPHPLGAPAVVAPAPALPVALTTRPQPSVAPPAPATPRRRRARMFDGGLLGTLALTAAVVAPVALLQTRLGELGWAVLWPVMGGVTALLLAAAALTGRARYLASLRRARVVHHLEGLGVGLFGGAALAGLVAELPREAPAVQWLLGFVEELGMPLAGLALVVLPVLGHALFFREVYARRLQALVTPRKAAVLAAGMLALSHGLVPGTLLVGALALHAAWLRRRSGSAVPGLLEDLAIASVVFGSLLA